MHLELGVWTVNVSYSTMPRVVMISFVQVLPRYLPIERFQIPRVKIGRVLAETC